MKEWWDSLSLLGQIFCLAAVPATVIMAIQSILLLFGIGFGSDADVADDVDTDGANELGEGSDGLSLFTIRGLVAFFAVGGWSGLVALQTKAPNSVAIIISLIAGLAALFGIALLFKYSMKLQSSGNLLIDNAIGKTGEVYIPIPANRSGTGKITITVQEQLRELTAVTSEERVLKTGEFVKVKDVIDEQTVMVVSVTGEKVKENKGGISKWVKK